MITLRTILLTTACIACFLAARPALATTTNLPMQTAEEEGDVAANPHDLVQGLHVEGHIAFLKAELGLTAAQEALWIPVADAMREDVRSMQEAERKVDRKRRPDSAIEYLENRAAFVELRAQGEARFLTAFRPLYNNLSTQQKRVADGLLIPGTTE